MSKELKLANLDRLKRLVETAGRPCPMRLGDRCPGERSGCAFWITETIESGAQHEIVEGCMFMFQYLMGHEQVLESVRTQATLQQAGETVRKAVAPFQMLVPRRMLEVS